MTTTTSFPPAVERAALRYFEARLDEINRRTAGGPEWGFTAEAREAARVINRRWGALMGQTKRARILASYDWLDELRARQNAYDAAQAAAEVK